MRRHLSVSRTSRELDERQMGNEAQSVRRVYLEPAAFGNVPADGVPAAHNGPLRHSHPHQAWSEDRSILPSINVTILGLFPGRLERSHDRSVAKVAVERTIVASKDPRTFSATAAPAGHQSVFSVGYHNVAPAAEIAAMRRGVA